MTTKAALPPEIREQVQTLLLHLCAEHRIPVPVLDWSTRMKRVLGRAYVDRRMIRLSAWLDETQAMDTLRHELAHVAVGSARRQPPHGPKWQAWAMKLGVEPRATARQAPSNAPKRASDRRYWGLECPGCGLRLARARVLSGLYHRDCGPRKGVLRRIVHDRREVVFDWVAQSSPDS